MAAALVALALLAPAAHAQTPDTRGSGWYGPGASGPAYAPDGRLAFSMRGDIWVRSADPGAGADSPPALVRVTEGSGWDREPEWTRDGGAIIFVSDRAAAGELDLWRVAVDASGEAAAVERLTRDPAPEREPTVLPDGSIVFVRGAGAAADLWRRWPDGREERMTAGAGAERAPAASPSGDALAYVRERASGRALVVRDLATGREAVVNEDLGPDHPAWSPAGTRLAFTAAGDRGVWVASLDGRYANLVSERRAAAAWSPDGDRLALIELPPEPPPYNGEPDRLGPARDADTFPRAGRLRFIAAPSTPDAGDGADALAPVEPADRAAHNAEVIERVRARIERLYFAGPDPMSTARRAEWRRIAERFRDRALPAADDATLERVVHAMVRARPPARSAVRGRAAVSAAHPLAADAGVEILRRGGNVVDAAVAVSFALGVVEPDASGIGGYGQMIVSLASLERPVAIEFLTRVPGAASLGAGAALDDRGRLPEDGPALVNVPGTVAGMWTAWRRYGSGRIEWAELVEPAIRLASDGVPVSDGVATTLSARRDRFLRHRGSRDLFFPAGEPLAVGDTLRNPDLAWTLARVARDGAAAFYRGEVAERIVADLRGRGSSITRADLRRYFAVERSPVRGEYRGHTIWSSAPPTSGGASLVARLQLLEHAPGSSRYVEDATLLHAMIEAWKLAPSTRGRIADPGLWPIRLQPFVSRDTAGARWRCFDPDRALPAPAPGEELPAGCDLEPVSVGHAGPGGAAGGPAPGVDGERASHPAGTTAFAVADADGNMVSVTQTLGTWGGSFYVTPGLGFIYNDKLRSYGTDPGGYNARLPYARNVTSISPTVVFRGAGDDAEPFLAVGAAGNAWIGAAVYQMVAAAIDAGVGPQEALELPRFLVGSRAVPATAAAIGGGRREPVVLIEDGFSPDAIERLEALGHHIRRISLTGELRMGYGAAVMLTDDGAVVAGADPRRSGAARAIPQDR
ncbi:MAG: gamma-glutamyltransferase [Gemmatimonadota bacterium]